MVERSDGAVVLEAVLPSDDAEPDDVAVVVEHLELLGAGGGGEAGHQVDLTDAPHVYAVAGDDVAATEEALVCLRLVEAAHQSPDGVKGGGDPPH